MNKRCFVLALAMVSFRSLPCIAATLEIFGTVELPAKVIEPRTDLEGRGFDVFLFSKMGSRIDRGWCRPPKEKRGRKIGECMVFQDEGETPIRIEVVAPGYKKFSKTLMPLSFKGDHATVDLGTVSLRLSELPKVTQVLHGRGPKESHVFEITFSNPLRRKFLVKKVDISALIPGIDLGCCCPPSGVFVINDELRITGGDGGSFKVEGGYLEHRKGKSYEFPARGEIVKDGCTGAEDLTMSLRTSFVIPAVEFSSIVVHLPKRFSVRSDGVFRKQVIGNGEVDRYSEFSFAFTTTLEDEAEIVFLGKIQN